MNSQKKQIWFMVAMSVLILIAARIYRVTRPPSPSEQLAPLREELALLRAAADSCSDRYSAVEAAFVSVEARVDSLGEQVRYLESLDPAGVPGERYAEYLEAFDAYNDAVPIWEARAESLEAQRARCASLTERHNQLADSARSRLIDLGRWPADSAVAPSAGGEGPPDGGDTP